MEIWEIYVEDESLAKSILAKAKAGHDFTQLAQKYFQDKSYASKGGYLGYRYIKGRGAVSQEAFKLGPGGKIGGPVRYRKGWVILKTGAKNEKSIKSFDSVKKLAESYVHNERIANNRVQWEEELDEKYTIEIYYDKLEEI
jgi:parvulin-like peptidyl-prolyl isomerase